jgi:hypothetical protein
MTATIRLLRSTWPCVVRAAWLKVIYLEDAADNEAISDYVEVVLVPLAAPVGQPWVDTSIRTSRRSHAHTRLRRDARGGHESVREELAAGVNAPFHEKKKPRASHLAKRG